MEDINDGLHEKRAPLGPTLQKSMVPKRHLSKRTRNWILGLLLVAFTISTLAAIPFGVKADPSVAITLPYSSIKPQMIKEDPERVVPSNIYESSVVPSNSLFYQLENLDQGNGQFDRAVSYLSPLSQKEIEQFESSSIKHFGWKVMATTTKNGRYSYYLQKSGEDGNVWEMLFEIAPSPANLSSLNTNISSVITVRLLITSFQ